MINLLILYTLQQEYEQYEPTETDGYVSALGNDTQTHFVGLVDKTKARGGHEPKM